MSEPTRRAVLRGAVVAGVSVAVPALTAVPALAAPTRTAALRRSTFTPVVGQSFTLALGSRSYTAKLDAIGDFNAATKGSDRAFTLLFRGTVPAEGICQVSNSKIGSVNLFVAPVGGRSGVAQAVIST
ncbi:MAG: hypothetical protein JWM40_1669 [Frankiales bacterium]|nr:hypothetical protein [Frankiales bacterium]